MTTEERVRQIVKFQTKAKQLISEYSILTALIKAAEKFSKERGEKAPEAYINNIKKRINTIVEELDNIFK